MAGGVSRKKVGVLISGRGSNLQALIDAAADPGYPAEIALVVSDKAGAAGLERARNGGIATQVILRGDFEGRDAFEDAITAALEAAGVELVCLAGFMRILSAGFVERWRDRLVNIHPSLLPLLPGLDTHARALELGLKLHGCSVHFVRTEMDCGPLIGQAAVPVLPGDTPDSLAARVLEAEHRLYPACLKLLAEGKVTLEGERAQVRGEPSSRAPLSNPEN